MPAPFPSKGYRQWLRARLICCADRRLRSAPTQNAGCTTSAATRVRASNGQPWPVALHRNRPSEGKTEEEGFDSWEVGTSQLALRSRRECAAHRHMMQTQGGRLDSQVVRKPMCASLKCWGNFKFRMNTCLQFVKELGWISGQQISDQTTVTGERSCGATYEFLHIADIGRDCLWCLHDFRLDRPCDSLVFHPDESQIVCRWLAGRRWPGFVLWILMMGRD